MQATRILIIDDDPIDRQLFRLRLEESNLGPLTFCEQPTGRHALAVAEEFQPDCVLLDYHLPDIDGLAVLQELGGEDGALKFAVVMLTAQGTERIAVESMKRGLMDYLPKGRSNLAALPRTVQGAIQKFRMSREIAVQREALRRRNRDLEAAQRELLKEKDRYRTLNEAIPQLVWTASPAGIVNYANRRCKEFSGRYGDEEWPLSEIIFEEDAAAFADAWSKAKQSGGILETESRLKSQDGRLRWHLLRAIPERKDGKEIVNWFGTCTDIDDQRRTEETVRQQQKLDSIGLLAGGIAHDFNNLLTGVMSGASLAQEMLGREHAVRPILDLVLRSSERAAHLTRQLLAYAGKSTELTQRVSVPQLIREACELVRASFPKSLSIESIVDASLPPIDANPSQMQQLVMNLLINGAEAIGEESGRVTVSACLTEVEEDFEASNVLGYRIAPGDYVRLEIADNGCGMDDETRSRVFEPFFTTKFTGRGLGLAAVYGIVRTLHGAIEVTSAPALGTTFRIHIPARIDHSIESAVVRKGAGRVGNILLIDDEESIRTVGRLALERIGHTVLLAHNGTRGVDMFRLHRSEVDLVLLDMNMPDKSGVQVLTEIKEISQTVPVAIVSGYSEQGARAHFYGKAIAGFIQKPFTGPHFAEQVAKLLEISH